MLGLHVLVQLLISEEPGVTSRHGAGHLSSPPLRNARDLVEEVDVASLPYVGCAFGLWSRPAEMDMQSVLLAFELAEEGLAASLLGPVPQLETSTLPGVHLSADEANALVCRLVVRLHVRPLGELLLAALECALDRLAVLNGQAGVVDLHVLVELVLAGEFDLAEDAINMFVSDVGLEENLCGEANWLSTLAVWCVGGCFGTFVAPKPDFSMLAIGMSLQCICRVVGAAAAFSDAEECLLAQVLGANVSLQRVMLAKRHVATFVAPASVSLFSFVDQGMASQLRACGEAPSAARLLAHVLSLLGVGADDVLLQMLGFCIRLVAVLVCAYEGAVLVVRADVGGQACGPVEGFVAAGDCALEGLVFGGELAAGASGGCRSQSCIWCWICSVAVC